jgi:nucleoside triphosphate pyrophosphatase
LIPLTKRPPIVLASASPRRQELLKNAALGFVVRPADIDEVPFPGETPLAFAERMAREKARAARKCADEIILAADTVVAIGSEILGKPQDADDAIRMLLLLSGKTHSVITAVCLAGETYDDVRSETTQVRFSPISEDDIREYVKSGEPMDKAGAYAIQGGASKWVSRIEGDYYNVVGLPLDLVTKMLRERDLA